MKQTYTLKEVLKFNGYAYGFVNDTRDKIATIKYVLGTIRLRYI